MPARPVTAARGLMAALVSVALLWSAPAPAAASEPPSWSDVQEARKSAAAAAAMASRLEAALDAAEARAAAAGTAALDAAAAAAQATADADAAAARASELTRADAAARAELASTRRTLGTVASGRYRTGSDGTVLARLLTSAEPETLLARLGLLDRLTATWAGLAVDAQRTAATAQALQVEAEAARVEREAAAQAAARTAAGAQAAADAEAAAVGGLRDELATLYAQLAALRERTVQAERDARAAQQAATNPAAGAGGSSSGSSGGGGNAGGGSGAGSGGAPTGVHVDPAGAKAYARTAIARFGWGDDQFQCLVSLWNRESGWRADALNPSSGAYGIPQSLPASKMASAGADWRTNGNTQIEWGLSYIKNRYGSPCGAWDHSQRTGWY